MYVLIPQLRAVYSFRSISLINCLREYAQHPALLPAGADGFTCLELKPLAQFISLGF
jgi:hypothetical protein